MPQSTASYTQYAVDNVYVDVLLLYASSLYIPEVHAGHPRGILRTALLTLTLMGCEIPRRSQTDFFNLPNALLALAMRLVTSATMLAEHESVLPRYVNLSTDWSLRPFSVMLESCYRFPGADRYITSVFLVVANS